MSEVAPAHPASDLHAHAAQRDLTDRASAWLDLMRGLAAIVVFVGHWRILGLVNYPDLARRSLLLLPLYIVGTLGHQAVMVFFVLSGYFVGGSVLRSIRTGTWSWRSYAVTRFTRLGLVLWPSLLACAALDYAGIHLFGVGGVYGGSTAFGLVVRAPVELTLTPWTALCNALFLQGIVTPPFGSNGALWSLSYEFWYYVAFPLFVLAVTRSRSTRERIASALGLVVVLVFIGGPMRAYFAIWLFGAAIAAFRAPASLARYARVGAMVLAPSFLAASIYLARAPLSPLVADMTLGVITALLVASVVADRRQVAPPGRAFAAVASFTSRTSYSLYLTHLPMVVFLAAATHGAARWQPTPALFAEWCAALVATYLYALVFYRLTESHTNEVRRAFMRLVRARPRVSPVGARVDAP